MRKHTRLAGCYPSGLTPPGVPTPSRRCDYEQLVIALLAPVRSGRPLSKAAAPNDSDTFRGQTSEIVQQVLRRRLPLLKVFRSDSYYKTSIDFCQPVKRSFQKEPWGRGAPQPLQTLGTRWQCTQPARCLLYCTRLCLCCC